MIKKRDNKFLFLALLLIVNLFTIGFVSSAVSYCCERTTAGAWCQNAEEAECNSAYLMSPTSCESTSYCKLGCCYSSKDGVCMENTPQAVCEQTDGGYWNEESASCDITPCTLGCCLIGNQAAFVTQTRCSHLSSVYGLEINFRGDITNEVSCIASATEEVLGACVFNDEYSKTCLLLTQAECYERGAGTDTSNVEFHSGYLCSAPVLGTECGMSEKTTCVDGRDEVFFVDTCGNLANIYDSDRVEDPDYWTYIAGVAIEGAEPKVTVDCTVDGTGARTCGDCNYFLGSTCKIYNRYVDGANSGPEVGDYICRDLGCIDSNNEEHEHGESWCAESDGTSLIDVGDDYEVTSSPRDNRVGGDVPGSRYFRMLCYNNEIIVEPCAEYRQEICLQSDVGGFTAAACRVNKWQDCGTQDNQKDCENTDMRDCTWMSFTKKSLFGKGDIVMQEKCVPRNSPGFNFWEEGDASELCAQSSSTCVVKLERKIELGKGGLTGNTKDVSDWKLDELGVLSCKENCQCLTPAMAKDLGDPEGYSNAAHEEWLLRQLQYCSAIGDCGVKFNILGVNGDLTKADYIKELIVQSAEDYQSESA